ncbi:MAG: peptidylprolyl isomerase [Burkholderiaceae bacterium]|jgi:peptidyl-prolyl cis-trans isomerase C|nr:peptidylprolyl isomerase [Burkholderiaceae bacterium]MCU0929715.1 peptidylprolyl isomerase [Burkholderiaceae bacterium]
MNAIPRTATEAPSVNGVPLTLDGEALDAEALRQRASVELLRQAAIAAGLLDADDPVPIGGATSEAASAAIEALLERELARPTPDDVTCRRYHAANAPRFAVGERVWLRHVLFAVTPGVDVAALRQRAEAMLIDLRARAPGEADRFAAAAAEWSNCPSGAAGGDLGWLGAEDCAPEFAREVFGHAEVGVLPRLVHSRFGLHVVEVLAREAGAVPAYEAVQGAVRRTLEAQAFATALRQYLQRLAGEANVRGVDLDAATSPLVQ